jgi:5'-methylthioadenosine phosphorylase
VDISDIIATLGANSAAAKQTVANLPERVGGPRSLCPCGCDRALESAIMTAPDARDPAVLAKLDAVAGRVL